MIVDFKHLCRPVRSKCRGKGGPDALVRPSGDGTAAWMAIPALSVVLSNMYEDEQVCKKSVAAEGPVGICEQVEALDLPNPDGGSLERDRIH